ncbi:unnamed protein product [Toxocara canis]|uniref:Cauli_VI domain-containing protein n=1 Tax=Toxocara canis TaxID=6265 RepID=A0A183VE97_TOXCA|nr:unnamed protein product [Toxocara canis]
MNWYFGLSKTGTKCLVVESEEGVRQYRRGQLDAQKSGIPEAFPSWKAVRSQYSAIVRRATQPVKSPRQYKAPRNNESSAVQELLSVVHNMEARMQQYEHRIQQLEDQLANRDIVVAYEY